MTVQTRPNSIYRLLNREYHESFDFYTPRLTDFYELVSGKLPQGWQIKRSGIWFQCISEQQKLPDQGWKIHVSATRANATEILQRVSSLLFAAGDTAFKFALDMPILCLLNGKNWPRASSGKFITIYPSGNGRFLELIEQIHGATCEFQGPYILSDRPYKESRVVFYRYGGMRRREALDVTGERILMLVAPDGTEHPDRRLPYPETPAWIESIVPVQQVAESASHSYSICEGRFQVEGVIAFSNSGGVYLGTDAMTGARVVIKEARPFIEVSDGHDAPTLLRKEYRLLALLADTGIAPRPVHLFQEGDHWFLVEEYIQGLSLRAHSASHNILLRTRPSESDFQYWYKTFRHLSRRLLEIIEILQSRNVVFSDLSPNNLIVTEDGNDLRVIDFEAAYQLGVDEPTSLFTPGFAPTGREGGARGFDHDRYSAGAVLMAYLFPVNSFFHLRPDAKEEFLKSIQRDARLPGDVAEMVLALMKNDVKPHTRLSNIAERLPATCAPLQPAQKADLDYAGVLEGVVEQLLHATNYERQDRLFPADPKLFATNPLSLAYGAAGIAYAIKRIRGSVPRLIVDWILQQPISTATYPPGLYVGIAGIAWVLLELGEQERAEELFRLTFNHNLLTRSSDLFYGAAGWGMTSLRFFRHTGDETYLQKAIGCGKRLIAATNGWKAGENRMLGLAHGASGIALFLLYLYLTTREERFLAAGRRTLEMDLAAGVRTPDGGLSWKAETNSPNTLYPYWCRGSAGIGTAVVRYHAVAADDSYSDVLQGIFIDTDRRHAVLPGRFAGLTGIGDFLLDAWSLTGEQKYFDSAQRAAEGLMLFRVARQGIAFPGDSLNRLSCDYGTGSAGVALFLNRLLGRQGSDFLLDELLEVRETRSRAGRHDAEKQAVGKAA